MNPKFERVIALLISRPEVEWVATDKTQGFRTEFGAGSVEVSWDEKTDSAVAILVNPEGSVLDTADRTDGAQEQLEKLWHTAKDSAANLGGILDGIIAELESLPTSDGS